MLLLLSLNFILAYLSCFISLSNAQVSSLCPNKQFGVNCSLTCHCSSEAACNNSITGLGCELGSNTRCDKGFTGSPACQTSCLRNKYEENCELDCHCFSNQTCEPLHGNCKPDNLCATGYYGPGCSYILPRFYNAPEVLFNDCSRLWVQWPPFVENVTGNCTTGVGQLISSYHLESQTWTNNVSGEWQFISDVSKDSRSNNSHYSVDLTSLSLINSMKYSFRVTCIINKNPSLPGLPGPASVPLQPTCVLTTTSNPSTVLTTTNVPQAQNLLLSVVNSNINVTWNSTSLSSNIDKMQITVQPLMVGDCQVIQPNDPNYPIERVEVHYSQGSWSSNSTKNWIQYQVSVLTFALNNISALLPSTYNIITAETFATGTPGLQQISLGTNWFAFNLSFPACQLRGGVFLWFDVKVFQWDSTNLISVFSSTSKNTLYNITSTISRIPIVPFTSYYVEAKYVNKVSPPGPSSFMNVSTLEAAPAPPTQLTTLSVNSSFVLIGWQKPNPPLANIVGYRLWIFDTPSGGNTGAVFNKTLNVSADTFSLTVNGLGSISSYRVHMLSLSNNAISVWSVALNFVTSSAEDQVTQLQIQGAAANVLTLNWAAPGKNPSSVQQYLISVSSLSSLKPNAQVVQYNYLSIGTSKNITNLQAATRYQITVRADYGAGDYGTNTTIIVWTPPGPIAAILMQPFKIISTNYSSALIQFTPVTGYTEGPISNYYVLVRRVALSGTRRRRRSLLNSDFCVKTLNQTCDYIAAKFDPSVVAQPFVLGNNDIVGGQSNPPLQPSTTYQIYFAVTSQVDQYTVSQSISGNTISTIALPTAPSTASSSGLNLGLLLGLLAALLILLIIVILLLLYMYRKGKLCKDRSLSKKNSMDSGLVFTMNGLSSDVAHYEPKSGKQWNLINDVKEPRFVVLDPEYGPRNLDVNRLSPDSGISFEQEYYSLPAGLQHSVAASRQPENVSKNRTPHIVPYDHCRVTLERSPKSRQSDYINASFIDGYLRRRAYIAAQSPMDAQTAADFWLMITQQNVAQIVMLCQTIEDTVLKSFVYWPPLGTKGRKYGDTVVECVNEEQRPYWLRRRLLVDGHLVTQFCFQGWPEHGVPDSPMPLIEFYLAVKMNMRVEDGPLVVHCGTGVSRTAVFVAVDSLLQQAHHEGVVNVQRFCIKMRRARPNMIRTPRQYVFLYDALFEALMSGSLALVRKDVHKVYSQLANINPRTGHSFFWEQQALLEKYTPRQGPCNDALALENVKKNRNPNTLPPDVHRVLLHCAGSQVHSSDYINAVWLDGWSSQRQVILTQTPMPNTIEDVWRLIWDHQITVVVDLQPDTCDPADPSVAVWWPQKKKENELRLGAFLIRREDERENKSSKDDLDSMDELRLSVTRDGTAKKSHHVRLLRPCLWKSLYDKTPLSKSGTVAALRRVLQLYTRQMQQQLPSPLLFMCADGAERCGLAAACIIAAAALKLQGYVDVFHVVRWMKLRRHQILPHLDQYRYVFRFLQEWLRSESISTNGILRPMADPILESDCSKLEESIYTHGQVPVTLLPATNYHYATDELMKTLS